MTASVGLRWEYYPYPRRADRGLEVFNFTTNLVEECGVAGSNSQVCNIKVQKDLFTPRLGFAYRPTKSTVLRVGFSRNPQNDSPVIGSTNTMYSFPATILLTETGPNTFTPVGSLNSGADSLMSIFRLNCGALEVVLKKRDQSTVHAVGRRRKPPRCSSGPGVAEAAKIGT